MDHAEILKQFGNPRLLKRGGQKAAYHAVSQEHGEVVVKIGGIVSTRSLARARREVETLKALQSPYYPRQYDFRFSDSHFIVVEEYIASQPLAERLDQFADPAIAAKFLGHLVAGLRLLWAQRIVHRDLKPDNILVRPDGVPVIIDLGIARLLDAESLTLSHAVRGPCTPVYAAPEQLLNRKAAIDARTDQFALGIILVQLLLGGRHPFDPKVTGSGETIVDNILAGKWAKAAAGEAASPAVVDLAIRLLGPEPHMRYRTADALADAVHPLAGGSV